MTIKSIITRVSEIQKISIIDVDHAADEIVEEVLKRKVLFFNNRMPVIKMPLHYQRISPADAEALIFNLLDKKAQMAVPHTQIKEIFKRLIYVSEIQTDLTEEFWKSQMYVAEEHIKHRRLLIHSAGSFLTEKCKLTETGRVSKVALYSAYDAFCKANALKPDGRNSFYERVRNFDATITDGRVPDSSGNSVQGFHGISLIGEKRQITDGESDE